MADADLTARMDALGDFAAFWHAALLAELVERGILPIEAAASVLRRSAAVTSDPDAPKAVRDLHRLAEYYLSVRLDLPSRRAPRP